MAAVGRNPMLGSQLLIVDKCDAIVAWNMLQNIERDSEFHVAGETTLDQFPTRTGLCEHIGKSGRGTFEFREHPTRTDKRRCVGRMASCWFRAPIQPGTKLSHG